MASRRVWTRPRVALLALAVVLVLLAGGQLVLPRVAADRVRGELGDDRADVEVVAFPAWKLVLGHADRITIDTPTVGAGGAPPLDELLRRSRDVGDTRAVIHTLAVDDLRLRDVRVRMRDGRLSAEAALSIRALSALVPGGGALTALAPDAQGRPRFSARIDVLGVSSDVPVVVGAVDGRVQVRPESGLGSLLSITVFQDPALRVRTVSGAVAGDTLRLAFSGDLT
jgi:hypothetical protein